MSITTRIKQTANRALRAVNLKMETLTAEKHEDARMKRLLSSGYFARPAFPLLPSFSEFNPDSLFAAFVTFRSDLSKMMSGLAEPGCFDPTNNFYSSPDAEILYLIVRSRKPRRIVEVGSGNSTRIIRQAIVDGDLEVEHVAIDPLPRSDIGNLVDHMLRSRFEDVEDEAKAILRALRANDILFIDSTHEVRVANDVTRLFCAVVPLLVGGVIIHVHDIFLPFDYPEPFCDKFPSWGEQYLLHMLLHGAPHELLWPGYYIQKLRPELHAGLPFLGNGTAQSFWFESRPLSSPT